MNQRERVLLIAVAAMAIVVAGYFGYAKLSSEWVGRQNKVKGLQSGIEERDRKLAKARRAKSRLALYEEMALPANREHAQSQYHALLLSKLEEAGLTNVKVTNAVSGNDRVTTFKQLTFNIQCQGNLEQLITLLHRFYSRDHLHRIRQLRIQPIAASKNLTLLFVVDGLSMPRAANEKQLLDRVANRLEHGDLTEYLRVIADRNLFSPANRAPKLASLGTQTGYPDRNLSFTAKASDPDELDQVRYELAESASLPNAKLDPKTGAFQWSPKEKGEFEIAIKAIDNGIPARSDTQMVKISVTDPPPEPPKPTPKLDFDHAKYTKLTAILEERDERKKGAVTRLQAWLLIQPTGESVQLYQGDSFTIGSVTAKVSEITTRTISLDANDKRRTISLGQSLLEGTERPIEDKVAGSSGPSEL